MVEPVAAASPSRPRLRRPAPPAGLHCRPAIAPAHAAIRPRSSGASVSFGLLRKTRTQASTASWTDKRADRDEDAGQGELQRTSGKDRAWRRFWPPRLNPASLPGFPLLRMCRGGENRPTRQPGARHGPDTRTCYARQALARGNGSLNRTGTAAGTWAARPFDYYILRGNAQEDSPMSAAFRTFAGPMLLLGLLDACGLRHAGRLRPPRPWPGHRLYRPPAFHQSLAR